jgi:penicillin-binding protein 1A
LRIHDIIKWPAQELKEDAMDSGMNPASKKTGKKNKGGKNLKRKKVVSRITRLVIVLLVIVVFAAVGIAGGAVFGYIKTAPAIDQEALDIRILTSFVYDSEGREIARLTGSENKNRELVYFNDTSKYLRDAFVAVEDERFYSHFGIDLQRTLGAIINYIIKGSSSYGGSTITQQVVKNITGNVDPTPARKIQEWWNAIQLERRYEKWQILELYMNVIFMGHGCYGVQSASKMYFGKDASDLSLAESAFLAGITNAPATYDPFDDEGRKRAKERQEIILKLMLNQGMISKNEYEQALKEELNFARPTDTDTSIPVQSYFVDQVVNDVVKDLMEKNGMSEEAALRMVYNYGVKIYSTQDSDIQKAMDEVFNDDSFFYFDNKYAKEQGETPQAAMAIVDPYTGHVKALYGGYGEKKGSRTLNRATQSKRQPGSSIKPIAVYAPAIDLKKITAATVIDDVPVYLNHQQPDKIYPTNYDTKTYDGLTTIRNALKASVNVVAARVWKDYLGYKDSLEYMKKSGIDRSKGVDENSVAIAMGGLETGVSPLEMAAAYAPFVNKGIYHTPITYTKVVDSNGKVILENKPESHIVYSEQTAYIMVDMLKEVPKGRTSIYPHTGTAYGIISIQNGKMPVGGKTGTTSDNLDKWFVGFTPYYTAAVWYGYDNKTTPIRIQSPEYGNAQKIWNAVMNKIHDNLDPKDFPEPAGLVKKNICIYSGKLAGELCGHDQRGNATKTEYFIKGTEPRTYCDVHVKALVCNDSTDIWGRNLLAGTYCPKGSVSEKVFIQRPPEAEYVPRDLNAPYPVDWKYELPKGEYCTVHGPYSYTPQYTPQENYQNSTGSSINTGPGINEDIPPDISEEFRDFLIN